MDKQQSDHIENRFRQAAENFLPPLHEEAWKKMDALLDKDKKKRRPFAWFWIPAFLGCLLLGGAALYYHFNSKPESKTPVPNDVNTMAEKGTGLHNMRRKSADDVSTPGMKKGADTQAAADHPSFSTGIAAKNPAMPAYTIGAGKTKATGKPVEKNSRYTRARLHVYRQRGSKTYSTASPVAKKTIPDTTVAVDKAEDLLPAGNLPFLYSWEYPFSIDVPASMLNSASSRLVLPDSLQRASERAKTAQKQDGKQSKVYFIASVGKNATSLRKFDTKDVGNIIGAEIGYHLNSFLSVQAGFHAGRKIYFAGASDYKFNPDSVYWRTVTILKIDANCLIFDVPLSARYDVLHNRHTALYATAGLSSFIMKSENYNYHYNSTSGYHQTKRKYSGNINLFSSANLSVGLEQKIFKTLYIQAEPYMKMPVSGIGEGKIKLYSLGMQVGLKYQPLKR